MYIKDGLKSEPKDVQAEKEPSTVAADASKTSSKRPKLILSIKLF
jgi:hypothetical protein